MTDLGKNFDPEPQALHPDETLKADVDMRLWATEEYVREQLSVLESLPEDDKEQRFLMAMNIAKIGYFHGYNDALGDGPEGVNLLRDHSPSSG